MNAAMFSTKPDPTNEKLMPRQYVQYKHDPGRHAKTLPRVLTKWWRVRAQQEHKQISQQTRDV